MAPLGLYVAASLALIATPGQDMLYVIARSLAQGRWAGLCSAFGVCLGILVHTGLAALGAGALLRASETGFLVLKLIGAAYLVYLGVRMLVARTTRLEAEEAPFRDPLGIGAIRAGAGREQRTCLTDTSCIQLNVLVANTTVNVLQTGY